MTRDALDEYVQRRRRRRLGIGCGLVLLVTLCAVGWTWRYPLLRAAGWHYDIRVERQLRGAEDSILHGVDLAEVHAELLPAWWLAVSRPGGGSGSAAEALAGALAQDPVLAKIYDEMRNLARDPWDNATRLIELSDAWSEYLDEQRVPWMIEANVMRTSSSEFFYVKSYEVVADTAIVVDGTPRRVRVVRRVDGTNLVEGFLGHAGTEDGGSLVALDRLTEFVSDVLWPMLADPDTVESWGEPEVVRTARGMYGDRVRAEIEAGIEPASYGLLQSTAATRARFLATIESIQRRRRCSDVVIHHDWLGLPGDSVAWAIDVSRRDRMKSCPGVTEDEAVALRETTGELSGKRGLEEAFGDLLAWYARHTSIHEARHVADLAGRPEGADLACPGCPADFPTWGRDELSAYLATFATSETAYSALLQACEAALVSPSSAHMAALDLIGMSVPLNGCQEPPPPRLVEQARELEVQLFGRTDRPVVPDGYPTRIQPTSGGHRRDR